MWVEKHGRTWRIRDVVAGQKVTLSPTGGLPTKAVANAHMRAMKTDQARGDFIDPRSGRVALAEWVEIMWPLHAATLRASTARTEGSRVRNHIVPLLGRFTLDELEPIGILQFVSTLAKGRAGYRPLSPKTIRNVHGILHKILDEAVRQRLIRINPATGTGMPPKARHEMRFLTEPEVGRLLAATPERWRPLVTLFVATGLRYGEAVALRVGDVDLVAGTVRVVRTLHHGPDGKHFFTDPKTEYSRRTVTIPTDVCLALAPVVVGKDRGELLFCMDDGAALTRTFRQNTWHRITEKAGLGRVRIHDLRHSHAALLISANVPLTAVQRRLGHSSIKVTSDLYGHLMPEVDAGIMRTVEGMFVKIDFGGDMGETGVESAPLTSTLTH